MFLEDNGGATNYISTVQYSGYGFSSSAFYTYDKLGNIATVYDNNKNYSYEYDGLGRLTRENNQALGFTKTYKYDANGNIKQIIEFAYMLAPSPTVHRNTSTYTYSTGLHKDRLVSISNSNAAYFVKDMAVNSYDSIGNPCNYRGNELQWSRGRNLTKYGSYTYSYNASGVRQEKVVRGVTHTYYVEGSTIHKETRGSSKLWYCYDQTGITGLNYNGTNYYFQKNILGATRKKVAGGKFLAKAVKKLCFEPEM